MTARPRARSAPRGRTLVAGFGNELRGDDGLGLHVLRRLRQAGAGGPDVDLVEVGAAGITLVQQLLDPYDRLIIVDAIARGGAPGAVYALAVEQVDAAPEVDMHLAVPARALGVARALGSLPREVWIVGCEPEQVDELTMALSPSVAGAVEEVVRRVQALLAGGAVDLARRDEVLQVLFWLTAEGLGPDVAPAEIVRFVGGETSLDVVLAQLTDGGYVDRQGGPGLEARVRLTPLGVSEGRRRFLDEFEPYLARRAHGECGSADCDCHAGGECQAR